MKTPIMEDRLSAYECKALKKLGDAPTEFLMWGELVGIGRPTLASLVEAGARRDWTLQKIHSGKWLAHLRRRLAMHVRRDPCGTIGETVQRENISFYSLEMALIPMGHVGPYKCSSIFRAVTRGAFGARLAVLARSE